MKEDIFDKLFSVADSLLDAAFSITDTSDNNKSKKPETFKTNTSVNNNVTEPVISETNAPINNNVDVQPRKKCELSDDGKYNKRIEVLISAALADGKLTEKEKQILYKNAEAEGIDLDEFEMVLDARLVELEKAKEETMKSAPKSNKLGDVRKCPACGALVNSFHRKCQECGYVFENIQANNSVTQLLESLRKVKDEKERLAIISSFPIPSSKGDLMELISVLHPKVFPIIVKASLVKNDPENEYGIYVCKYEECLEKIKLYFPDDEVLLRFVNEYKKGQKNAMITMLKQFVEPILALAFIGFLIWLIDLMINS